ncbi:MAG: ABC transporter ATP-binding protein [Lentisphaeria bacterium]|nr:ABC transporter ATP-binding protein [Lentisphaeria bacterium]
MVTESKTESTFGGPAQPLISVSGVRHSFGGLLALDNVSFDVQPGCIKAVIGPNGAGKTTLFNIISGLIKPDEGQITFRGKPITGLPPHRIGKLGLSRTFQNLSLFENMTVLENVMVGAHRRSRSGILAAVLHFPRQRREERETREIALRHLEDVGLEDRADLPVGVLSFGQRRLVELARALASDPEVILLDEPASGLNTWETINLGKVITQIRDRGVTMLLVEHDMSLVMDISDHIVVLNFGEHVAEDVPEAIRSNKNVITIYLGGDFDSASD